MECVAVKNIKNLLAYSRHKETRAQTQKGEV